MSPSIFDIQTREARRIAVGVILLFLVYSGLLWIPIFALSAVFQAGDSLRMEKSLAAAAAVAALILAIQVWFAERHGLRLILESLRAEDPDLEDSRHRRLVSIVEELNIAAGGAAARVKIVPTLSVNAFALADRTQVVLGVTEGLISKLSRDQAMAVAAHEMAHVVNGDCRLATWVCAMAGPFLAMWDEAPAVSYQPEEADSGPSVLAFFIYAIVKSLTVLISRRGEIRADAKAIELTRDPISMAEALWRISSENHFLGGAAQALSPIFIVPSRLQSLDARDTLLAELFSSHPPIDKRMKEAAALAGSSVEQVAENLMRRRSVQPPWPREEVETRGETWRIQSEGAWVGPFSLGELAARPDFGPQSWVARISGQPTAASPPGSDTVELGGPAYRDPLLARHFRNTSPGRPTTYGACPSCGGALAREMYEGTPLGRCGSCGGALIAYSRVQRVLARRDKTFSQAFLAEVEEWLDQNYVRGAASAPTASQASPERLCPQCAGGMTRQSYSYQYFVPIDRCFACDQLWFDARELELLQALVERRRAGIGRPPSWKNLI